MQEYGQRVDGQIAGWGMAFSDHAEVISVDQTPLDAAVVTVAGAADVPLRGTHITARLIWPNPGSELTP